ncbi:MAG: tetratricopeptide repeat protein [Caulobacterales bacterium]
MAAETDIRATFDQALALHRAGRLDEAEPLYEAVLAVDPRHFDALYLIGLIAVRTGRAARGVELISRAIAVNPGVAEAHAALGGAFSALGRLDAALASFDQALALKPDYPEALGNRANALMALKQFEAALASYERLIALTPGHPLAHNNRGVALSELGRPADALASFDQAIALSPDYAEAHSNRSRALADLGRREEALASSERALALGLDTPGARFNRGNALKALNRLAQALASYDDAIALEPGYAEAHSNRGSVLKDLDRLDEALASYDQAIALRPADAEAHTNRGNTLRSLMRLDEALASYERAIALNPAAAEALYNRGLVLLQLGRFEEGWRLYEARKRLREPIGRAEFAAPLWLGDFDIAGKTILLWSEQGLGDTLQFCRYASLAQDRGARVILSVQPSLLGLLRQLGGPTLQVIAAGTPAPAFDCHCPLMSLPLAFGTTLETIPAKLAYLTSDAALGEAWAARLGTSAGPRIGLAWRGSPGHRNDRNRSLELETLAPLLSTARNWISLQKELNAPEAAWAARSDRLTVYAPALMDFPGAAALIDLLDLVITVDTSIAHLAGALGKPVWILLPFVADFRWMQAHADSPWYPSARLFRQRRAGDWTEVIEAVKRELEALTG